MSRFNAMQDLRRYRASANNYLRLMRGALRRGDEASAAFDAEAAAVAATRAAHFARRWKAALQLHSCERCADHYGPGGEER